MTWRRIAWHLQSLNEKELRSLAKKVDPHLPQLSTLPATSLRSHIESLSAKQTAPSAKPVKPDKGKSGPRFTFADILKLTNGLQRRMELEKLTAAALKSGVKDHRLGSSSLSSKPSKIELIEHIQATLSAGLPADARALDESKY